MKDISKSVKKKDHEAKITGQAMYVGDYATEDLLFGKILHSPKAKAKILEIKLPAMP